MALTAEEYGEIVQGLVVQLEESGFGQLLEEVMVGAREPDVAVGPRAYALAVLDQLISALERRSGAIYGRAMDLIGEYVEVEGGIEDIRVVPTPDEMETFGLEELSLSDIPQYGTLVEDLRSIRTDLANA